MTGEAKAPAPLDDALLAARLYLVSTEALGGLVLRGAGPARDLVLDTIRKAIPTRRIPPHVDEARLLGGVDIVASLTAGKPVMQAGLLAEAAGATLIAPMAERMSDALAGRLAQGMDAGSAFGLVLLDDGIEADERPPTALRDRVSFVCDLSAVRSLECDTASASTLSLSQVETAPDEALTVLAGVAMALGVDSVRPLLFALSTARAEHAAGHG